MFPVGNGSSIGIIEELLYEFYFQGNAVRTTGV